MAAGDASISQISNAGNQPKQRSMAEDWNKMNSDYKLAMSTARSMRDEELSKARDAEKNAKRQYNDALRSGDQTAIDKAKGNLDNAKAAKEQVNVAYAEAKNKAKDQRKLTHDSLRSAEKEHNNESADATMNLNKDLADIQEEQTKELSKQFSNDKGSDSQDTDNQSTDNQESDNQSSNNQSTDNQESDNKNNNGGKSMSKNNGFQLSQSFYDAVGRGIRGQPQGNENDVEAKTHAAVANDMRNSSAHRQMEAQQAQQIANQNPYAEAGKIASVQNDAENRQNVQKSGVIGAGAALARKTNTPDVQSQMQREDQQRQVATQQREKGDTDQTQQNYAVGASESAKIASRDQVEDTDESARLSLGDGGNETTEVDNQPAEPEQPGQQPEPEQPAEPAKEEVTPEKFSANWQNVMNYMTYGNDPKSGWNPNSGLPAKPGRDEAKAFVEAKQWQPLSEEDVKNASNGFDSPTSELQDLMSKSRGDFMSEWQNSSGRVKDGQQINQGDEGYDEAAQTNTEEVEKNPPSDARIKDIKQCLCDARMKWIKEDWDRDGKPSREDMMWLVSQQGPFHHNDRDYDPNDYDNWEDEDDSVLNAYAENIKNYVYNYKPEATEIDSSIDPNQEHIGPMAQDIEQVNPACVKETPEGVKTVDTARLAMMNAGAIGDLAREMQEIKERLNKLGV